jgi:hypothetical protein
MADLSITATSVSASNQATVRREYQFGATITAGQVVYLNTSNRWALFDSNVGSGVGANVTDLRGIALNNGSNTQPAAVCTADPDFTPGATLSNGVSYYGSPNAGAIAPIADLGAGNYPVFLGVAKSTTKLNLNPTAAGIAV